MLGGCQRGKEGGLERLLDASSAVAFSRESISSLSPAGVGAAAALASPAHWIATGADRQSPGASAGSLLLESSSGKLSLAADVAFDASQVDVLRVVLRGLAAPALPELAWSRQGEDLCAGCSLRMLSREGTGSDRSVFAFEVGARAEWHGKITRLVLRPTTIRGNRVEVGRIELLQRALLPVQHAEFDRTVLFSADGESRPARILAPGRVFRTHLAAHSGETLRFALARERSATASVRLRVSAIGSTGAPTTLFESSVPPGAGWQELAVELGDHGEREADLQFEVESQVENPGLQDLTFLSGVELESHGKISERMNVLLVSIDTLRADRLSAYGYSRPTSPHLEALVEKGAFLFEKVVAAASSTLPAHASMLSGLDVFEHGAFLERPVAPRQVLLAELFQQAGYRTLAITGGGYVHPRFGLSQGFDRFRAWPRGEVDSSRELGDGLEHFQAWLDTVRDRPFFFFFHTYEVHAPYRAREPYYSSWAGKTTAQVVQPWAREEHEEDGYFTRNRWPRTWGASAPRDLEPADVRQVGDLYDSGVAQADFAIGELLRDIAERNLDRKTLVVVTADHGESLGENGFFDHGYMYDTNLLIPLVIFDPRDRGPHARLRQQVRQIDILPTVLELAGLQPPPGISGRSLVSEMAGGGESAPGHDAWSYGPEVNQGVSFRRDGLKFIFRDSILRPRSNPDWEAYALQRDPTESHPLSRADLPAYEALRAAAIGKLAHAAGGIVVSFENRSPERIEGILALPGMDTHNSKLASAPNGSFSMPSPGELRFEIPSGESSRVRFQFPGAGFEYRLRLQRPAAVPEASGTVELADLCGKNRTLISRTAASGAGTGAEKSNAGFEVVLSGGCDPSPGTSEDPELAARLRALGYLR